MTLIKDTEYSYESFKRSGDTHVQVYRKGELVASVLAGPGADPLTVALAWINQPIPEPPEKTYTETEITTTLREKGYIDDKTSFSADMPVATAVVK